METIKRNNSVRYRDRVTLEDGKIISRTFSRKTDLAIWKRTLLTEVMKRRASGIQAMPEIKLDDLFNEWFEKIVSPSRAEKTGADYRVIYNKHFRQSFGSIKTHQLRKIHIEEVQSQLLQNGRAPKTTNKILGVLRTMLNFAVRREYLIANPMIGIIPVKAAQKRLEYLSSSEISRLLNEARFESSYPIFVTALNTGMRIGEILGLCWDAIRWDSETIEVSRSLSRTKLDEHTKTNLIRYIPMTSVMKVLLRDLQKQQRSPKFVFTNELGESLNPDHFCKRVFHPLLKRAGIRKIRFHDLRHTFASQFMMRGGNIYELQKFLGHTSVVMTQVYAHLSPQHLKRSIQIMNFKADGLPNSCHEAESSHIKIAQFSN